MDDRCDIAGRVGALAVHVDARRWNDVRELFAPEVHVDYTSLFGSERQLQTRDDLIAGWRRLFLGFARTTHLIGAPAVAVSGATARAFASVVAWHFLDGPASKTGHVWLVGGCYEMAFQRPDGAWRITELTLARAWSQGTPDTSRMDG